MRPHRGSLGLLEKPSSRGVTEGPWWRTAGALFMEDQRCTMNVQWGRGWGRGREQMLPESPTVARHGVRSTRGTVGGEGMLRVVSCRPAAGSPVVIVRLLQWVQPWAGETGMDPPLQPRQEQSPLP